MHDLAGTIAGKAGVQGDAQPATMAVGDEYYAIQALRKTPPKRKRASPEQDRVAAEMARDFLTVDALWSEPWESLRVVYKVHGRSTLKGAREKARDMILRRTKTDRD
jgi:hypothetical protein